MKYLYSKFRTTAIITDTAKYGLDSIAVIRYSDTQYLVIRADNTIKEFPEQFYPQALIAELEARIVVLSSKIQKTVEKLEASHQNLLS